MMFWHVLPGPVTRGRAYRIPPISTAEWEEHPFYEKTGTRWPDAELCERAKYTNKYVLKQFWKSFVDCRFDLENTIQTKAKFSCAIAVLDKIRD